MACSCAGTWSLAAKRRVPETTILISSRGTPSCSSVTFGRSRLTASACSNAAGISFNRSPRAPHNFQRSRSSAAGALDREEEASLSALLINARAPRTFPCCSSEGNWSDTKLSMKVVTVSARTDCASSLC